MWRDLRGYGYGGYGKSWGIMGFFTKHRDDRGFSDSVGHTVMTHMNNMKVNGKDYLIYYGK